MIILLNLLVLVPLIGFYIIKKYNLKYKTTILGVLVGLVISPLSLGLYSLFFIPYIGIIFLPFLLLTLFFGKPAWYILVINTAILDGANREVLNLVLLDIFNGIFWAIIFGLFGFIYDQVKVRWS